MGSLRCPLSCYCAVSWQVRPRSRAVALPGLQGVLLEALLDLVDTHWTGCHSLHSDKAFLGEGLVWGSGNLSQHSVEPEGCHCGLKSCRDLLEPGPIVEGQEGPWGAEASRSQGMVSISPG